MEANAERPRSSRAQQGGGSGAAEEAPSDRVGRSARFQCRRESERARGNHEGRRHCVTCRVYALAALSHTHMHTHTHTHIKLARELRIGSRRGRRAPQSKSTSAMDLGIGPLPLSPSLSLSLFSLFTSLPLSPFARMPLLLSAAPHSTLCRCGERNRDALSVFSAAALPRRGLFSAPPLLPPVPIGEHAPETGCGTTTGTGTSRGVESDIGVAFGVAVGPA